MRQRRQTAEVARCAEDRARHEDEARQAAENVAVELRLVAMWLNLLAQG